MRGLLTHHRALLRDSAISDEVADSRGYQSANSKAELGRLGFSQAQRITPALVIPIHDVNGKLATYLLRPDQPRVKDGRALKYELPPKSRMVIDVPPLVRDRLGDPAVPLLITEGARKADAAVSADLCCVDLIGVWCWRGTNEHGGKAVLPDFDQIAFNDRLIYIVFDSDVMEKRSVHSALERFLPIMKQRGADVRVVYLPSGDGDIKVGLDDYLAAGNTRDDLLGLAGPNLRPLPSSPSQATYEATENGISWTKDGSTRVPLTNFQARIVADVVHDDGADQQRYFEIETDLAGRQARFEVSAREFDSLSWVNEEVGAGAIVSPGYVAKEHTRVAVKVLSDDVATRVSYRHLGWRQIDGEWVYLHADGGISATGARTEVDVELPDDLRRFRLAQPVGGREELVEAVRASLGLLEVVPPEIGYPALAATYRAPLGPCAHGFHLTGDTGLGKSQFAALIQQHYGPEMDAEHLPASRTSTANYLEGLTFATKDAICVVDDLTLGSSVRDRDQANRLAERVYRAQGNQQGRGRMRANSTLRETKYPRGIILGTSEDLPAGQSLRARVQIAEFDRDTLDWTKLTELQGLAAGGLLAQAMASYIRHLATDYDTTLRTLPSRIATYRNRAHDSRHHRRTAQMTASLAVGLETFLDFAAGAHVIDRSTSARMFEDGWRAFGKAADAQVSRHRDADPTTRFLELLASVVNAGKGHLTASDGSEPDHPERWGWIRFRTGQGESEWRPQGRRLGHIEGTDLYLDLDQALGAAQQLGAEIHHHLAITPPVLAKRLHERGFLRSTDIASRKTHRVRRTLNGKRTQVLHLGLEALEVAADPTPPTPDPTTPEPPTSSVRWESGREGRIEEPKDDRSASPHDGASQLPLEVEPPTAATRPDQSTDCPYPTHRAKDWTALNGRRICGVCHPPASPAVIAPEGESHDLS